MTAIFAAALSILSCLVLAFPDPVHSHRDVVNLIIDTDLLSWPDDGEDPKFVDALGAIAVANAFQQLGKVRILGIASDVRSRYSVPAIDAINTYYGHPDIPLAQNRSITNETAEPEANPAIIPVYVTTLANSSRFPENIRDGSSSKISDPVDFYHRILSSAEDNSVTITAIGFFTNLAALYNSPGGKDLIERKVKVLVMEACSFASNLSRASDIGYNLRHSFDAARVLVDWPSPVTFLGDDIGATVVTGSVLAGTPASNPVRAAYEILANGTDLRQRSWDLMTTYFSIQGISEGSFKYGNEGGRIQIFDNVTAAWNFTAVVPHSRRQHFLVLKDSNVTIGQKLDNLLMLVPNA